MNKCKSTSANERATIPKRWSEVAYSTVIAKEIKRDPRTSKKAIQNINFTVKLEKTLVKRRYHIEICEK